MIAKNKTKILTFSLITCCFLFGTTLFAAGFHKRSQTKNLIAKQLGWIPELTPDNLCEGYYVEPILFHPGESIKPLKKSETKLNADYISFSTSQRSLLKGNVVITQPGRRLEADKAYVFRNPKTEQIETIDLYGNIHVYEPGRLLIGQKGHFNLIKKSAEIDNIIYRVLLDEPDQRPLKKPQREKHYAKISGTTGWGAARKAIQTKPGHFIFHQSTYTTCAPNVNQWKLVAEQITLDKKTGKGHARNVHLDIKGIPLFYMPYLSFPIVKKRESGFLFPTIGASNISGFKFGLPYYWNIAPNYDATFTPALYSKRGVLFDNQFRYLTRHSQGQVVFAYMPQDQEFKKFKNDAPGKYAGQFGLPSLLSSSNNRYLFHFDDLTQYNEHWSSGVDYSTVSDDYYFQDFGTLPSLISTNQLLRQAYVNYTDHHWHFSGQVQDYDTLHAVNRQPVDSLYSRLPQLKLEGNFPGFWHNVDFALRSEAVYFTKPFGAFDSRTPRKGGRFDIAPSIATPFNWIWGYFTPRVTFATTQYSLTDQIPHQDSTITRALPIFNIDSSLFFDRNTSIMGHHYQQTLEPRLFYLLVPYQNQNDIPVFDSAIIPFTYDQLFRTNRFSGYDRIGDANQISLALTTRLINESTGQEQFKASIGQIIYFRNRRVKLCHRRGCTNFFTGLGATSNTEDISPIAGEAGYHINYHLSTDADIAWDPHLHKFITGGFYFSYNPSYNHILDVGYSFIRNGDIINRTSHTDERNNLHQISVGFSLPINQNWSSVGILNYNISHDHPQTYMAGLEYQSCCWAVRVVAGRVFSNLNQNGNFTFHNAFYLQWSLKGLGNFGVNSVSDLLTSQINGYHDEFSHTINV